MTHRDHYVRCRGIALTEFVLVLPLAFVLFIGILDFGRVFYTAMTVSHAARAGVQYGAQDNIKSGDFPGMEQAARTAAGGVTPLRTMTAERHCRCMDATGSCGWAPGAAAWRTGHG